MKLTNEQKILQTVVSKAWEDPNYMDELVTAPAQAIVNATGQAYPLPDGIELLVHDQTDPNVIYLNIPPKPSVDDVELTDEQLEAVAGGGELALSAAVTAVTVVFQVSYTISYNSGW